MNAGTIVCSKRGLMAVDCQSITLSTSAGLSSRTKIFSGCRSLCQMLNGDGRCWQASTCGSAWSAIWPARDFFSRLSWYRSGPQSIESGRGSALALRMASRSLLISARLNDLVDDPATFLAVLGRSSLTSTYMVLGHSQGLLCRGPSTLCSGSVQSQIVHPLPSHQSLC